MTRTPITRCGPPRSSLPPAKLKTQKEASTGRARRSQLALSSAGNESTVVPENSETKAPQKAKKPFVGNALMSTRRRCVTYSMRRRVCRKEC